MKILSNIIFLLIALNSLGQTQNSDGLQSEIPKEGTLAFYRYQASQAIGTEAPDFRLETLTGDSISLTDYQGKVILIKFWGLGCPPCMKSTKEMVILDTMYSRNQFEVVGIIPAKIKPKHVKQTLKYLEKEGATFVNGIGSQELIISFSELNAIPTFFLVDKNGIIQYTHVSDFKTNEEFELLISNINRLL